MAEAETGLPEVYLQPGQSHVVRQPAILRTLLGSCVGITFRAPRIGAAALCHPMLPNYPLKKSANLSQAAGGRYVDFVIRDLARQFDAMGARRGEIEVKLFGGGDVLMPPNNESRPTVGRLNCEVALRVLQEEGLHVMASSLGGRCGVNIFFNTETGEVLLKRHG